MASDHGLFISTLNSAGHFLFSESDRRQEQDKLNASLIEAAAELDAGRLVVIAGGIAGSGLNLEESRAKVAHSLAGLDEAAGKAGVRLALEPIHPVDLTIKGCINSIQQALEVTKGLAYTDLIVDLFHSYWDDDVWRLQEIGGGRIAAVQVCN